MANDPFAKVTPAHPWWLILMKIKQYNSIPTDKVITTF